MSETQIRINLKAVRTRAGVSLSQAADLTGVSKAMLGQIERGESSPTIATLWKLARGFHMPLTAFLQEMQPAESAPPGPVSFPGSITVSTVFPFDPRLGSETFLITLNPGQEHVSLPHEAGVIEDVFVTLGAIEVLSEETWQPLPNRTGLRLAADQPHGYRNPGTAPAQFLNVMHYPQRP